MKPNILLLSIFFSSILWLSISAQQTINQNSPLNSANDLVLKEHYAPAHFAYARLAKADDLLLEYDVDKEYNAASASAELQHGDAEKLLEEFIEKHPTSTRNNRVWLQLGHLYFRNNTFRSALDAYENVSTSELNKEEKAEFTFKRGYSNFRSGNTDKAVADFSKIKDTQTKYTGPATYYYAHIMYEQGNYETALRDFEKLRSDETFKAVAPYYMIQIYYTQGRHEEMLAMANPYLEGTRNKRTNEMLRLVADVNYRKGNYDESIKLMEEYNRTNRNKLEREDHYMLGYSYYATNQFEKAISEFQSVANGSDSLAQNAYYHLGDSYLKTDQKQFAANAFVAAWKIPLKTDIAEDALFNYAKLSVELSNNPYNEAIKALQQYLQEYPGSPRKNEAYTYLANLYLVTRNYEDALKTLESIDTRNAEQNTIYQKITYYRALELFNEQKYYDAIGLFKKSIENKTDPAVAKSALFWQGESYYRLEQYEVSRNYFREFVQTSQGDKNYANAQYNLAYSHFKLKDYLQAQKAFSSFLSSNQSDVKLQQDARLRLADCHFMMKQYTQAASIYDQAAVSRNAEADYALYQKSIATGLLGDNNLKINSLQQLLKNYPKSPYADNAQFEIGRTYLSTRRNNEALSSFQKLISDYPKSSLVREALLNIGLIYYNTDRDQLALETLKRIVKDYPSTETSREALALIKNIHVEQNTVDQYVTYAEDVPFANISKLEQDSLIFTASESRYMSGDCERALPGFISYLEKFPQGSFSLNAHYYKADCESRAGQYSEALKSYEAIISRPRNQYTENSALKASSILYNLKDYQKALAMFQRLEESAESRSNLNEAVVGLMRCNYHLGNYGQAILYAQRIMDNNQVSGSVIAEAHLITGRSAMALGRTEQARSSFQETLKNSTGEPGAEALYNLAEISFNMKEYGKAEEHIFKLSSDFPSYQYWLAKGFILLSDIYVIQGNTFQARQTLQSIIDNYTGEELRQVAINKLKELNSTLDTNKGSTSAEEADEEIIIK